MREIARKVITAVAGFILLTLLLSVLPAPPAEADPDWWDADWQYRIKFTIDAGDVGSELSDFPVLVHLSSSCGKGLSDLSGIFNGKTKEDGEDIRFVIENPDPSYEILDYEIEEWDNTGEEAWIWVRIPTISSDSDTEFYMYYGNPDALDGQNATAVWDDNFMMVQHLGDDPDTSHTQDSTVNNNAGTKKDAGEPIEIGGKIGRGQDFDGIDDKITMSDSPSLSFTNNELTIEAWVKVDTLPGTGPQWDETSILRKEEQWQIAFQNADTIRNLVRTSGTDGWTTANDESYTFSTDTWYYWTFVYDGSNICHLIDAQQVGDLHTVTGNIIDNSEDAEIGRCDYTNRFLDGIIDEVRVSNTARSADWIAAQYLSMTDNFITYTNQPPDIPTLASPPGGETGLDLTPDLIFYYSDPDGDDCTKFDLKLADNPGFSSPEINETDYGGSWSSGSAITYSVSSPLSPGTQYYWRARVFDGTVWSDWSNGSWDFTTNQPPDPPDDLGPIEYIDGRWGDNDTPTLEFTQNDPDGDDIQYRIQIIHDGDGVVVDYTSELLPHPGATSFTVGQAAGGGTYDVYSATLPEGDYYWQVMSIDEHGAGGDWTEGRAGDVAFQLDTTTEEGGTAKERYNTRQDVYVTASGFLPDSYVDVYVVKDRAWRDGDAIPSYVVKKTIQTDGDGDIVHVVIWSAPLKVGEYDVVFDAGQDRFYNEIADLVDHPNHPGFSVVSPTVGGEVHPINKAALLMPWLGLAFVLILAVGGGALTLIRHRTNK